MSSSPNKSSITLHGKSTFEHVVRRLGLSSSQYTTSEELKEWVRKNKDEKYVPPNLLTVWGFEVEVDIAAGVKKPPKRAA